jgi:cyanate permease
VVEFSFKYTLSQSFVEFSCTSRMLCGSLLTTATPSRKNEQRSFVFILCPIFFVGVLGFFFWIKSVVAWFVFCNIFVVACYALSLCRFLVFICR